MTLYSPKLFEEAVNWLMSNYRLYNFFVERDIVWTLQTRIIAEARKQQVLLRVYDNHKLRGGKLVDLAVVDASNSPEIIAEIKYEPDHNRTDISAGKLNPSRVFWNHPRFGGVEPDIARTREFVNQGMAKVGHFILIDEGSHFCGRPEPEGSLWVEWGKSPYSPAKISVLIARFPS